MTPRTRRAAWVAAISIALSLTLSGCGSAPGEESGGGENVTPAEAPGGWTSHEHGPVQLSAPADWEAFEPDAPTDAESTGSTAFGLKAPVADDGSGSGVFTVVSTKPASDAAEAMRMARGIGESSLGATGFVEEDLTWPGADAASYLSYEAELPMPSGDDVAFKYEFLTLDLPDGTQAIVNVVGPVAGYDDAKLHDVLASVGLE